MNVFFFLRIIGHAALLAYAIKRKSLTWAIFVAIIVGAEIGYTFPEFAIQLKVLSSAFLKLIKTIIAPLLFSTLVVGIAGHSNLKQVGRMGWKSLLYFEIVTTFALFIGLAAINLSGAGKGIDFSNVVADKTIEVKKQTASEVFLHVFPENIAKSIAEGQILQIVLFSILFGVALAMIDEQKRKPMLAFTESLAETMFKFTHLIMYFAPVGVGAAMAYTIGSMGLDVVKNLIQLLLTLYAALVAFILLILVPIGFIIKLNFKKFFQLISEPVSIAFATTSSEAALPLAMENMEKYGVPRKIIAFVMPTGYSFNLDGTTLYLSLASVFVAQCAGVQMSVEKQLLLVFTLMLTSKGVAGVPRASMVILLGTLHSFDLPTEPVFIILGIDALMDMARTAVNVIGNCLATVVIAKWENEIE
jgi:proton glutamate symport protein